MIEQHETPPVDPDVLAVREVLADYADKWGGVTEAAQIRGGMKDEGPAFQAALAAFRRHKGGS